MDHAVAITTDECGLPPTPTLGREVVAAGMNERALTKRAPLLLIFN